MVVHYLTTDARESYVHEEEELRSWRPNELESTLRGTPTLGLTTLIERLAVFDAQGAQQTTIKTTSQCKR